MAGKFRLQHVESAWANTIIVDTQEAAEAMRPPHEPARSNWRRERLALVDGTWQWENDE